MGYVVLNPSEAAVRSIQSYFRTLQRYRNTSMALHNRQNLSVSALAIELLKKVDEISEEFQADPEIERWRTKFIEYVDEYINV